jgi:DNA-binding NarL/FixJ family response regulator
MNTRILIADDHFIVRMGTVTVLKSEQPNLIIDLAENYEEVKKMLQTHYYDLIILDINMPGTRYTEMIPEIKNLQNDIKILIFSSYDQSIALQYINKGAEGYLNKQCNEEDIKNAVKTILETGYYYPLTLIPLIKNFEELNSIKKLTSREYQIFELLAKGNGNLEISNILNIQVSNISTFKKRVFEKLKINNIIELVEAYKNLH